MDKREAVRVPVQMRARCRTRGVIVDGLVEDVSRSGVFMRSPSSMTVGTETEVDLELPGEAPLCLAAEVVRVDAAGMGLRFTAGAHARLPLANFIMKQHASAIR